MPIFDHFDFLAPVYDRAIPFHGLQDWLEHTDLPTKGSLLDVGGGTGRVSAALKPFVDNTVVVDISHGMLIQARKQNLDSFRCYSESLCFSDNSFERIIMVDAFHHIIDSRSTVSEMWRVLKPGGSIVIHEPDIRSPIVWVVAIVEKIMLMRSHFISPPKIIDLFSRFSDMNYSIKRAGYTAWIIIRKA